MTKIFLLNILKKYCYITKMSPLFNAMKFMVLENINQSGHNQSLN